MMPDLRKARVLVDTATARIKSGVPTTTVLMNYLLPAMSELIHVAELSMEPKPPQPLATDMTGPELAVMRLIRVKGRRIGTLAEELTMTQPEVTDLVQSMIDRKMCRTSQGGWIRTLDDPSV